MEELSKAGEGPAPTPTKFTRTEQARREAAAGSAASGGATSEGGADAEAVDEGQAMEKAEPDPWEFQEAVDITTKIPSNFQENLTSPKWQERKAALEGVLTLLKSHSKLDPGANYGELMESLKNVKMIFCFKKNEKSFSTFFFKIKNFRRWQMTKISTYKRMQRNALGLWRQVCDENLLHLMR